MKADRQFMSIGEVLAALKEDFADVTVSKIRFLESEGLIEPERTAAGYRKFYPKDVDRLRFILTLQRDHFLPLKVIRERLAAHDAGPVEESAPVAPAARSAAAQPAAAAASTPASDGAASAPGPPAAAAPARAPAEQEDDLTEPLSALHLSEGDLANAAGLELGQVRALREFGVICEHPLNGSAYFDEDDLIVSRIARDFLKFGIEPRHLKMFRHFAEREAALFEQVVLPAMRHRSPEARHQATQSLAELARLSKKLRHAFLRQGLRSTISGDR